MKKVLILAVAIVMCASLASAQSGGHIGLYTDSPGYSDCNLVETGVYQSFSVYVVHVLLPEANTSSFKIDVSWAGVFGPTVTMNPEVSILGDMFTTGITITYTGCKPLPFWLAQLDYLLTALDPECATVMQVVKHPAPLIDSIEVIDCDLNTLYATGGKLTAGPSAEQCNCAPVGTEETSWSKIKALYQ